MMSIRQHVQGDTKGMSWSWNLGEVFPITELNPANGPVTVWVSRSELEYVFFRFQGLRNRSVFNADGINFVGDDALFIANNMWLNTSVETGKKWLKNNQDRDPCSRFDWKQ